MPRILPPFAAPGYETVAGPAAMVRRTLNLQVVTPLYGGAARSRESAPKWEPIRCASIRGQLRFWWRARNAVTFGDRERLWRAERKLWGGTGDAAEDVSRSSVILSAGDFGAFQIESDDIGFTHEDGYVLWPARATRGARPSPTLERVRQGLTFTLSIAYPRDQEDDVRAAVRDWVLFGGVGGRTRRGCGSLAVSPGGDAAWLAQPNGPTNAELVGPAALPGAINAGHVGRFIPCLQGALFRVGPPTPNALAAWRKAHGWLRDFRQGTSKTLDAIGPGNHARFKPFVQGDGRRTRAGQSRWPEPDKIRQADAAPRGGWAHPPTYDATPAWPRAQFGLPIQVQWQKQDRSGVPYAQREPDNCALGWTDHKGGTRIDRLPSPLIVKPMQLANGQFVALALWLARDLPTDARAGIQHGTRLRAEAPIGTMKGPTDALLFNPIANAASVRDAFMQWLSTQGAPNGGTL